MIYIFCKNNKKQQLKQKISKKSVCVIFLIKKFAFYKRVF